MGFLDIHPKLKAYRFRGLFANGGDGGEDERRKLSTNGAIRPVSHGLCQSVENRPFYADEPDLVVAQRKPIDDENELCFFGIFDARFGGGVSKYIEAHLLDQKLNKVMKKSVDTLRKAHLYVKTKAEAEEKLVRIGSTAAIVINGKKLVMANMGSYRAVICKAGKARELQEKRLFTGMLNRFRQQFHGRDSGNARAAMGSHQIDTKTEFVILGNIGIWEVMKYQEAVDLIWHIGDPKEAAECLVKEALTRMSRNIISCLIIRFD